MPFASQAQRRFMFAKHPRIANRWVKEAKKGHQAVTKSDSPSLVEIRKAFAVNTAGEAVRVLKPKRRTPSQRLVEGLTPPKSGVRAGEKIQRAAKKKPINLYGMQF